MADQFSHLIKSLLIYTKKGEKNKHHLRIGKKQQQKKGKQKQVNA